MNTAKKATPDPEITAGCSENYHPTIGQMKSKSSPITGLGWPRGFQEVKVEQSSYWPGVAQRVPGS
jgi:hypothetical protein